MEFHHISVLLNECIDNLNITPDGIYVDGTMGGGGHSLEIAKRLTTGRLICIDQDPNAHEAAGKRLAEYKDRITFVRDNFGNIANILDSLGIEKIDGMLLDIGVSSHQLDEAERGFSYQQDAPLDMRMNPAVGIDHFAVVWQRRTRYVQAQHDVAAARTLLSLIHGAGACHQRYRQHQCHHQQNDGGT